jgi:hypothetical protein
MEDRLDVLHAIVMSSYATVHGSKASVQDCLPKWRREEEEEETIPKRRSANDVRILLMQTLKMGERRAAAELRRKCNKR